MLQRRRELAANRKVRLCSAVCDHKHRMGVPRYIAEGLRWLAQGNPAPGSRSSSDQILAEPAGPGFDPGDEHG